MKDVKILKLKISQPHAHYRIPFTFSRRHTYPIPPYSTVIGLICNILGITSQDSEEFKKLKENLYLAIYGNFESMTKEYVWLRNLEVDSHKSRFGSEKNRIVDFVPEHPGGQIPTRIDVLEGVKLLIYIYHPDEEILEEIKNNFQNPEKRIYPLHLGRAEDLIVFDGNPDEAIKIIQIKREKKEVYGKLNYFTWIPDPLRGKDYFNKEFYDENFDKFFPKIKGSYHLITSFYKLKNGSRDFNYIPVKLFEQGDFPFYFDKPLKSLIDEDEKVPLFLCKMSPEEKNHGDLG